MVCAALARVLILLEHPAPHFARDLMLIVKTLQNLANLVVFGKKEEYMICCNEWINKNMERMKSYLDTLSSLSNERMPFSGYQFLPFVSNRWSAVQTQHPIRERNVAPRFSPFWQYGPATGMPFLFPKYWNSRRTLGPRILMSVSFKRFYRSWIHKRQR